jgi:tripartite-type tricarboxylate transporter receptor subunit TctC
MDSFSRVVALLWLVVLCPWAALAQTYPSKPVRLLVGTPAGGPADVLSRGAAQVLGQSLGQPCIVENRVGADTMLAGEACARSAPDGHTLCIQDNASVINTVTRAKMAYDLYQDLTPVVHFGFLGAAILVHPSVPASSWQELVALVKTKPESVSWGSYGLASTSNIYIEWLKKARNISFYNVPYKAASLAWPAMLAGEVQVAFFALGPAAQQVKAGKARALLVITDTRSAQMPDVPTYREAGLDLSLVPWFGLFAPTGTPRDIVLRLNAEVAKGLVNNPAMREKFLSSLGIQTDPPAGASPEALRSLMQAEREKYAAVVKVTALKILD